MIDMVSRFLLPASFAVIAMIAFAAQAQDPFSLDLKSTRPLPAAKAKKDDVPKLPDVLPPVQPPEAKKDAPPRVLPMVEMLATLVDLKASVEPRKVRRGETFWITISGATKPYAYTYSAVKNQKGSTTRIQYVGAEGLSLLAPIIESPPEKKVDEEGDHWIMHDRFFWKQELLVKPDAKPGLRKLDVQVLLQICTKAGFVPDIGDQCFIA